MVVSSSHDVIGKATNKSPKGKNFQIKNLNKKTHKKRDSSNPYHSRMKFAYASKAGDSRGSGNSMEKASMKSNDKSRGVKSPRYTQRKFYGSSRDKNFYFLKSGVKKNSRKNSSNRRMLGMDFIRKPQKYKPSPSNLKSKNFSFRKRQSIYKKSTLKTEPNAPLRLQASSKGFDNSGGSGAKLITKSLKAENFQKAVIFGKNYSNYLSKAAKKDLRKSSKTPLLKIETGFKEMMIKKSQTTKNQTSKKINFFRKNFFDQGDRSPNQRSIKDGILGGVSNAPKPVKAVGISVVNSQRNRKIADTIKAQLATEKAKNQDSGASALKLRLHKDMRHGSESRRKSRASEPKKGDLATFTKTKANKHSNSSSTQVNEESSMSDILIKWESNQWPKIETHLVFGQCIGEGSFAKVYHGFDKRLKKSVAIKIIKKKLFKSEKKRRLVQMEVDILAKMRHKNIVHFERLLEDHKRVRLSTLRQ